MIGEVTSLPRTGGFRTPPGRRASAYSWTCFWELGRQDIYAHVPQQGTKGKYLFVVSLLLHQLWKLPYIDVRGKLGGIACPPELLSLVPSSQSQRLFHYIPDKLCCWQPSDRTIASHACLCTIVTNDIPELHDHFGKCEHSYGHWLDLPLIEGGFHLWQILQEFPEAADPKIRDVTPLRLMSWLSCQLSERTHLLIKEAMKEFSQVEPVQSCKLVSSRAPQHLG